MGREAKPDRLLLTSACNIRAFLLDWRKPCSVSALSAYKSLKNLRNSKELRPKFFPTHCLSLCQGKDNFPFLLRAASGNAWYTFVKRKTVTCSSSLKWECGNGCF